MPDPRAFIRFLGLLAGRLLAFATVLPPSAGPVRRAVVRWTQGVVWLVRFEPTWFPEFGLAIGAIGWGLFAFVTDDMTVQGWACFLPALAILGGLLRCAVLLRLWYEVRVILAALGAALWAWLFIGLMARYGAVPLMGLLFGVFLIEMLTAAKFSIPCAQELRDEYLGRDAE